MLLSHFSEEVILFEILLAVDRMELFEYLLFHGNAKSFGEFFQEGFKKV
jgi:hypothetical protein